MHYLFVDKGSLHKIIALKMIFAVLLVSFPVSCGSGNDPNFSFTSIEQGTDSAISLPNDAQVFKITSQSEWDDFWSRHKANITPMPQQPSVDFAQYMVIAVIDNVHSSGGYVMEITQIKERLNRLAVFATRTEPGSGCVTAAVLTSPFHIVSLQRSDLIPELFISTAILHCSP